MTESNTDIPASPALSAGETLQRARQARGLTQQDIALSLRLAPEIIAALESDSAEQKIGKVFVQGYLRAYARLVDVASNAVVVDDTTTLHAQEPFTPSAIQRTRPKKGYRRSSRASPFVIGVIAIAAVVLLATQLWPLLEDRNELAGESQDVSESLPIQPSIFETDSAEHTPFSPTIDTAPGDDAETVTPSQPHNDEATPSPPSDSLPSDVEQNSAMVAVEQAPLAQLVLQFEADSWTEVNDARGERLMQSIGRTGSTIELSGVAPFDVLMGNAPGVHIEYNGEPYDSAYQDRRVARITLGAAGDSATP